MNCLNKLSLQVWPSSIDPNLLHHIISSAPGNLKSVRLCGSLGRAHTHILAEALPNNQLRFEVLKLSDWHTDIHIPSSGLVFHSLGANTTLTELSLEHVPPLPEVCSALEQALRWNKALRRLEVELWDPEGNFDLSLDHARAGMVNIFSGLRANETLEFLKWAHYYHGMKPHFRHYAATSRRQDPSRFWK